MTARPAVAALLTLAALALPRAARAERAPEGTPIADRDMPVLGGGSRPLLGKAKATVIVFFRGGQDHSVEALQELAALERELAGKPVQFVGIVSSASDEAEVREVVARTGVRMAVLLDEHDSLYGELGVRLHPVVCVADERHRVAAFQNFTKLNFGEVIRARVLHLLGELDALAVEKTLHPERASLPNSEASKARRHLMMARMMLAHANYASAAASAQKSLEIDPLLAGAHGVLAKALAAQQRCPEVLLHVREALKLDPKDPDALEAQRACGR